MAVKPTKLKVPDMGSVQAPEAAALGITWQIGVGHPDDRRSLVIQTYAARDDTPDLLKALLTKITDASDYVEMVYKLRALKLDKKKLTDELARRMEAVNQLEQSYRDAWAKRGKRGEWHAEGNEANNLNTSRQNAEAMRAQLTYNATEIRVLEELL